MSDLLPDKMAKFRGKIVKSISLTPFATDSLTPFAARIDFEDGERIFFHAKEVSIYTDVYVCSYPVFLPVPR